MYTTREKTAERLMNSRSKSNNKETENSPKMQQPSARARFETNPLTDEKTVEQDDSKVTAPVESKQASSPTFGDGKVNSQ